MSKDFSRRDFIKLLGGSAAASAVLTGCGPASRYVTRETYTRMPEYTYNGKSTFYATTCFECDAGCGLVVRTMQGRAIKVEGNQNNPVNMGKTCARGQTTLQGLYNPDRVKTAIKQNRKAQLSGQTLSWDDAIQLVADALGDTDPNQLGFLLGSKPDHLFDLVSEICITIGAPPPIRYSALAMYESRATLQEAANFVFKEEGFPSFDLGNSDIVFSFGSNFLETWLSPVAHTRAYSMFRKGFNRRRGYLVQFEPRMSQTAAVADEWIPIKPGTEGFAAQGLGRMVADLQGTLPKMYINVDIDEVSRVTGVSKDEYLRLAHIFAIGERPIAIPGGGALGQTNGLETAKMVLALNSLVENIGKPGGIRLSSMSSNGDSLSSLSEMKDFTARMASGEIKVLFVHGVNPVFEVPQELGFEKALEVVPLVISFSSFPDETALRSDYILPDHAGLESWGYQRVKTGINRKVISGAQPVVSPYYDTRSSVDVLLAVISQVGGRLASAVPFEDEIAYIKNKIIPLIGTENGVYDAPEINTFFTRFQQFGGWWKTEDNQETLTATNITDHTFSINKPTFSGDGEFYLLPFVSPVLGEGGANKPSLQEIPDPITTVMWNTWVEINNETAYRLDIHDNDVIRIVSDGGSIEVPVYISPGIRPDVIAIPFGQGHTEYGRYAKDRGANPNDLLAIVFNKSGDLAFASNIVKMEKTGNKQHLSRLGSPLTDTGFESH